MPHVDKPPWVAHEGKAINSVDISPDGLRLATSGSDSKVRLWSLAAVLANEAEHAAAPPQRLATLTDHTESDVNVVRFSPDGDYLASGGDDQAVILYRMFPGRGESSFGSGGEGPNHENWRALRVCRRHRLAVTDLAWCPDSTLFASCSLDGDAVVWAAETGTVHATLHGHGSFVKGVAWDPIGSYIATFGEDYCVRLWATRSWALVATVEKSLERLSLQTLFCRIAFSVLGDQLAVVNTTDAEGNMSTVSMCAREAWEGSQLQLVGHESPAVAARYSPRVFCDKTDAAAAVQYLAVGSQDKGFSVWPQGQPKPLLVLRKAFASSVSDIAWSPDGRALCVSSLDGTIASVIFAEGELGTLMEPSKVEGLVAELYGDTVNTNTMLAESADALDAAAADHSNPPSRGAAGPAAAAASARPRAPRAPKVRASKGLEGRLGPAAAAPAEPQRAPSIPQGRAAGPAQQAVPGPTAPLAERSAAAAARAPAAAAAARPSGALIATPTIKPELSLIISEPVPGAASTSAASPMVERTVLASNAQRIVRGRVVADVTCSQGGALQWATCSHSHVTALAGSPSFTAWAQQDGGLQVLSREGRRALPPLVLPTAVALMAARNDLLAVVLTGGDLRTWDVRRQKALVSTSVRGLLSGTATLAAVSFTQRDLPCVTLTSGHAFVWHEGMEAWMRVADWSWPASAYHSQQPRGGAHELADKMAAAQAQRPRSVLHDAARATAQDRAVDSVAHLECCVAAAEATGSAEDWRSFVVQYTQLLCTQGDVRRLQELCRSLMGPLSWTPQAPSNGHAAEQDRAGAAQWRGDVMGHSKRHVLERTVLPIVLASNAVAKVALDFQEQLKLAKM